MVQVKTKLHQSDKKNNISWANLNLKEIKSLKLVGCMFLNVSGEKGNKLPQKCHFRFSKHFPIHGQLCYFGDRRGRGQSMVRLTGGSFLF